MPTTYAVPNGRTAFRAITYTGNGASSSNTTQNITTPFYPDMAWVKGRNTAFYHRLTSTGLTQPNYLATNATDAQDSVNDQISALASTYFQVKASGSGGTNQSGATYVGWAWNANNGATVSNTAGSITSSVSVNTTSGCSVLTYTGTGSVATVGHGLGVAPSMIIVKNRGSSSYNWPVYHSSLSSGYIALLNTADAQFAFGAFPSAPTSSVFSIGTWGGINASSDTYIAYCFAQVAGYSQFGSYVGNGSTDGPFIYTGFRPAFILTKDITTGSYWWEMVDSARSPYNTSNVTLYANVADSEYTSSGYDKDLLSNGFKIRGTSAAQNSSGSTYIYMAFAENPFKYANAR